MNEGSRRRCRSSSSGTTVALRSDRTDHRPAVALSLAIDDGGAAPIGTATDGTVDLDLVRDGPHGPIAGTTGRAEARLPRTLALLALLPPDRLSFVRLRRGGATFDDLSRLPHVAGVVTDLEPRLAGVPGAVARWR